jgi:hypothetical protein
VSKAAEEGMAKIMLSLFRMLFLSQKQEGSGFETPLPHIPLWRNA